MSTLTLAEEAALPKKLEAEHLEKQIMEIYY